MLVVLMVLNNVIFPQSIRSRVSFSTDTWTTKQMTFSFACTIGSFIDDDWNLIERIVDFKALEEKEHEGFYGARAFVQGARGVGALKQMSTFACLYGNVVLMMTSMT